MLTNICFRLIQDLSLSLTTPSTNQLPKCLFSYCRRRLSILPDRAVCHVAIDPSTLCHQPRCSGLLRAFYHLGSSLHTCGHLPRSASHSRACCYFAIHHDTCARQATYIRLCLECCCWPTRLRIRFHQPKRTCRILASFPLHTDRHMKLRLPMFQFLSRVKSPSSTSQHILNHWPRLKCRVHGTNPHAILPRILHRLPKPRDLSHASLSLSIIPYNVHHLHIGLLRVFLMLQNHSLLVASVHWVHNPPVLCLQHFDHKDRRHSSQQLLVEAVI